VNEALRDTPVWSPPNSPDNNCGTLVVSAVEQFAAEITEVQSSVFGYISVCVEHNSPEASGASEETFDLER